MGVPTRIRVHGLHPVVPTVEEFDAVRDIQWGDELTGEVLERANAAVREHFAELYLIEIDVEPPDSEIDWIQITQPMVGQPRSNWQVPWDECSTTEGRWAFFMHFVKVDRPLQTAIGSVELPSPTPVPPHLSNIEYSLPG